MASDGYRENSALFDLVLQMLSGLKRLVEDGTITNSQASDVIGISRADWNRFKEKEQIPIEVLISEAEKSNSRAIHLLLDYVKQLRQKYENDK